jgi:hypothetical protein
MLAKNIYLIYPPGYSGSYLSWCFSKSENDLSTTTVDNPLNVSDNKQYGGSGSSHLHHRIPTHSTIKEIMYWLILNQPTEKKIFLVNGWSSATIITSIHAIMNFDRDPVIIHVTADNHYSRCIGNLNAITKWPLYFHAREFNKKYNIDFFNLSNDMETRNKFVEYYDDIFPISFSLSRSSENSFNLGSLRDHYNHWFTMRNEHNPHEVNDENYIVPYEKPKHFYSIDLMNIFDSSIFDVLELIATESELGDFNFDFAKNYHSTYVNAQPNLKFKDEIFMFRHTKILNEYLCSHPLLQALTVKEVIADIPNIEWKNKTLQEIVKVVQSQ